MKNQSPFIWHELVTPDQRKSGRFICELLGWDLREVDAGGFGTYSLFRKAGRDVAGMMNPTPDSPGGAAYWHSYIAVDDVDSCARQTLALGGKVLVPPHDVPDVGRICVVSDPMGAVVHLMQPEDG